MGMQPSEIVRDGFYMNLKGGYLALVRYHGDGQVGYHVKFGPRHPVKRWMQISTALFAELYQPYDGRWDTQIAEAQARNPRLFPLSPVCDMSAPLALVS